MSDSDKRPVDESSDADWVTEHVKKAKIEDDKEEVSGGRVLRNSLLLRVEGKKAKIIYFQTNSQLLLRPLLHSATLNKNTRTLGAGQIFPLIFYFVLLN